MSRQRTLIRTSLNRRLRHLLRININLTQRTSSSINQSQSIKTRHTRLTSLHLMLRHNITTLRHHRSTIKTNLRQRIRMIHRLQRTHMNLSRPINRLSQVQNNRTSTASTISHNSNLSRRHRINSLTIIRQTTMNISILTRRISLTRTLNNRFNSFNSSIIREPTRLLTTHMKRSTRQTVLTTTFRSQRRNNQTFLTQQQRIIRLLSLKRKSVSLQTTKITPNLSRLQRTIRNLQTRSRVSVKHTFSSHFTLLTNSTATGTSRRTQILHLRLLPTTRLTRSLLLNLLTSQTNISRSSININFIINSSRTIHIHRRISRLNQIMLIRLTAINLSMRLTNRKAHPADKQQSQQI